MLLGISPELILLFPASQIRFGAVVFGGYPQIVLKGNHEEGFVVAYLGTFKSS